ncbi:hypothetical protein FSP39_025281 [Pinctada imbricata]|uniref:SSD domain-containing protein n=1 Tax=Pinctada imbricata TaxID=66713 RepID=A0AA88Y9Q9_PINIB|nr:hypothetical protein FSP39_025281 [Pinctada imbricata]
MGCSCHKKYEEWIGNIFGKYGEFVAKGKGKPWIILSVCIIVNIGLMAGLLKLESVSDIEELYAPQNSEASKNRKELKDLFPNQVHQYFNRHAMSDFGLYGEIIIRAENDANIINSSTIDKIRNIDRKVRTEIIVNDESGKKLNFSDLCAVFEPRGCIVDGEVIFDPRFSTHIRNITYPNFLNERIAGLFGNLKMEAGIIQHASMVKLRYNLRDDNLASLSKDWEKQFEQKVSSFSEPGLDIAFIHSNSRNTELASSTTEDIKYFSVTFTLMITYASLASIGLNMNTVAWRPLLSLAGVLATILAIGSALGFASLIGIKFVSIVGVMPFLVIGIGLDDVFVLMSGMSDACADPSFGGSDKTIAKTLFLALKSSGIAITITSLTDFLAFGIGGSSVFLSVKNFCITTGIAVLFCYLNQLFFFVPCLVINERRVEENRHFLLCCKRLKSKEEDKEYRSKCSILCCSGHKPDKREEYDGPLERFPKILIKAVIRKLPCKIIILILFLCYLGISIYGTVNLKQGLELRNLATTESYYYKYTTWDATFFREDIPISFVIRSTKDYSSSKVRNDTKSLIQKAKQDSHIISDQGINWLSNFENSTLFNATNEDTFASSLMLFLNTAQGSIFRTDISFENSKISSSRFYVFSDNVKDSTEQADLMLRMREIASESNLPVFAYSPAFIFFEQYVQILPGTLQTVGIAIAVMLIITTAFMPQPIMIILVSVTMVMILVGIFGFMYFWDLTLSSITMIHLIMTVGFSVDFSAHICHAYLSVSSTKVFNDGQEKGERNERVEKALDRAGGPIINAAISSIVGILMLILSKSYIFQSFFKLMLLVILFGLVHSVFLLPVILSFIGPTFKDKKISPAPSRNMSGMNSTQNMSSAALNATAASSRNHTRHSSSNEKSNHNINKIAMSASDLRFSEVGINTIDRHLSESDRRQAAHKNRIQQNGTENSLAKGVPRENFKIPTITHNKETGVSMYHYTDP